MEDKGKQGVLMTLIICAPSGANWTSPSPSSSSPPLSAANPCGSRPVKTIWSEKWVAHALQSTLQLLTPGQVGFGLGLRKPDPIIPYFLIKEIPD
jgi:hypothetical protein